jgi:anti-sigma-K factor RskA
VTSVAAAALLVIASVTATRVHTLNNKVSDLQSAVANQDLNGVVLRVLLRNDVTKVALRTGNGTTTAQIAYLPDGTGFVAKNDLAPLPKNRTYQLWAIHGKQAVSIGVLGSNPGLAAFKVAGPVDAFAITDEARGGTAQPTMKPLVVGTV